MNIADLPVGDYPPSLPVDHMPTRYQAVVLRNWALVPVSRLADVLCTDEREIEQTASDLGLPAGDATGEWLKSGYLSIIRNNWHLLPYEQLLILLGWSAERLNATLIENDFFWHKLGWSKPNVPPVRYRRLTDSERQRTEAIRAIVQSHKSADSPKSGEFSFMCYS